MEARKSLLGRRDFISLVGGVIAPSLLWPLAARAQQGANVRRIGVLMGYSEHDPEAKAYLARFTQALDDGRNGQAEAAALALGVRLLILNATTPSEIVAAFASLVEQRIGALLVDSDPLSLGQRQQLVALAGRHGVPAIYHVRETVEAGGLMGYGANVADAYRLAGVYAGRILKGEKPADLPVQQSAEVELVINFKAATALGVTFPLTLLGRADVVIE